MIIELSWWLIPVIITLVSFIYAGCYEAPRGGYLNIDFEWLFRFTAALIASLVAWLIYALAT